VLLSRQALEADVRGRLFAPSAAGKELTVGAELELIPFERISHRPIGISEALLRSVRNAAREGMWIEAAAESGAPSWNLPDGGRISFEPGGQIEISSAPTASCSALIDALRTTSRALTSAAKAEDIELISTGVDPYNDISAIPLQLHSPRYEEMTRYFDARGESGVRMMRQTAALQINVEHGPRPFERWKLLNALAPYIVALFASSERYAGHSTGHASYRAHLWRTLDVTRTGLAYDELDPPGAYLDFALTAGVIRKARPAFESLDDWHFHLSTLFPEVRPKEYFEIRSADAIAPDGVAAPLVFTVGLVYDPDAEAEALKLLGSPDETLLEVAGREGLGNQYIRNRVTELVRIALAGAGRLGTTYISVAHRTEAAHWFVRRLENA
jgi:Gamma-glutamylcysteine synthetase